MYEYLFRGANVLGDDPATVSRHRGDAAAFLRRHVRDSKRALSDGLRGVRSRAPYLLARIADPRTLRLAWDFLAREGGRSPGPNGRSYSDLTTSEVWDLCRCLGRAIRDGSYRPGEERLRQIAKSSGRGTRPIVLINIEDRIVQRAAVLILQPLLDPLMDPRSFGYRPMCSHLHAFALAEWLTIEQGRHVWVTEDIRDAFMHVPVSRLVQVLRTLLPADDLLFFLERAITGRLLPGLRQGGSLSPMLMNAYLNHFLDRPWRRTNPSVPLIRVADDILILCQSVQTVRAAYSDLQRLLLPSGMPLKGTEDTSIRDLATGGTIDWLGLTVARAKQGLAAHINERAFGKLREYLALAHTKSDAPVRAIRTLLQWINQRGPCYAWSDRDQVCERIIELARAQAFEEVPGPGELQERWQRAHARWRKLRKAVHAAESRGSIADNDNATPAGAHHGS